MGNVVLGSALATNNGMQIDGYAMLHSAVSASCYDNTGSRYPANSSTSCPDTDGDSLTRSLGYMGHLGRIDGSVNKPIVNFYDASDSATDLGWNFNNDNLKPQQLLIGLQGAYY